MLEQLRSEKITLDRVQGLLQGFINTNPSEQNIIDDYSTQVRNCLQKINELEEKIANADAKSDPKLLSNWRPISLLCADYKIITKAISNKLQNALPEIIHSNQTSAVPGRSIFQNLWLIRDILDFAPEISYPGILLPLDQKNAFDRVNYNFLIKILEKFNFGENFIK